jgi:guanine deaminase
LLGELGHLALSDPSLAIQTHISENPAEVKETKKLFEHLSQPGKPITYAGVYDHYHLLRDSTVLAHAVHLEEEELKLIKERKSGISHCPTSNFNLTSGVAKVGAMLDREIKVTFLPCTTIPYFKIISQVGLGTDVSGGFAPSILTTIQHASIAAKVVALTSPVDTADPNSFASKPLKIATLFWLATLGGAQVCKLEHKIGSLEVGKSFDAIVVNIRNTPAHSHHHHHHHHHDPFSPHHNPNIWGVGDDEELSLDIRRRKDEETDVDEEQKLKEELDAMLQRLLFCGDDRNLRRVYVQGRWVGGAERSNAP